MQGLGGSKDERTKEWEDQEMRVSRDGRIKEWEDKGMDRIKG